MAQVWILIESPPAGPTLPLPARLSVDALKQAIAQSPSHGATDEVQVLTPDHLAGLMLPSDAVLCPLTLNLPEQLPFPGAAVFRACKDVTGLQQQVSDRFRIAPGRGRYWLPIVLTARGPLYAEAIVHTEPDTYLQPLHLGDRQRQPLYRLGFQLLDWLAAPPAVYLLQFGLQDNEMVFDRLWPFPAAMAMASLNVQTPDLFECHWRCLTHQPILDLAIAGTTPFLKAEA